MYIVYLYEHCSTIIYMCGCGDRCVYVCVCVVCLCNGEWHMKCTRCVSTVCNRRCVSLHQMWQRWQPPILDAVWQSNVRLTVLETRRAVRILPIQITSNVEIRAYFFSRVYFSVVRVATIAFVSLI